MAVTPLSFEEAMQDIRKRVAASRSSFTAGMSILPQDRRDGMFALYAFCREVDDIADDAPTQEMRTQGLALWRARITALFKNNETPDSITTALLPAIQKFGLVEMDFQEIINGMEMDAGAPICAPSITKLDLYCDRVASAVGRVSVRIFGDGSPTAMKVAHHLGRALQLTNILRDLTEDAERGRLYLPEELLSQHGCVSRNPQTVLKEAKIVLVCRALSKRAAEHFDAADQAMAQCNRKTMKPARLMRIYYGAIFDLLVKDDWKHINKRLSLSRWKKLWLLFSGLLG